MEPKTFEEYLQEWFMKECPTVLDDDLPDAFNDWLAEVDIETVIKLADAYAHLFARQTLAEMREAA